MGSDMESVLSALKQRQLLKQMEGTQQLLNASDFIWLAVNLRHWLVPL